MVCCKYKGLTNNDLFPYYWPIPILWLCKWDVIDATDTKPSMFYATDKTFNSHATDTNLTMFYATDKTFHSHATDMNIELKHCKNLSCNNLVWCNDHALVQQTLFDYL